MTSDLAWPGGAVRDPTRERRGPQVRASIKATLRKIELVDPSRNAFRIMFADQAPRDAQLSRRALAVWWPVTTETPAGVPVATTTVVD